MQKFLKNEYWKDYYEKAPSDICKEYIEMVFCDSIYFEDEGADYSQKDILPKLKIDDLRYLYENEGNHHMKYNYKKMIEKMIEGHPEEK